MQSNDIPSNSFNIISFLFSELNQKVFKPCEIKRDQCYKLAVLIFDRIKTEEEFELCPLELEMFKMWHPEKFPSYLKSFLIFIKTNRSVFAKALDGSYPPSMNITPPIKLLAGQKINITGCKCGDSHGFKLASDHSVNPSISTLIKIDKILYFVKRLKFRDGSQTALPECVANGAGLLPGRRRGVRVQLPENHANGVVMRRLLHPVALPLHDDHLLVARFPGAPLRSVGELAVRETRDRHLHMDIPSSVRRLYAGQICLGELHPQGLDGGRDVPRFQRDGRG